MEIEFVLTGYCVCLKFILHLSQLDIVLAVTEYCIYLYCILYLSGQSIFLNWILYFHLARQSLCMLYQWYYFSQCKIIHVTGFILKELLVLSYYCRCNLHPKSRNFVQFKSCQAVVINL